MTARNTLEAALPQLDAALKHQELVRWTAPEDSYRAVGRAQHVGRLGRLAGHDGDQR